jgi:hypothetical protein
VRETIAQSEATGALIPNRILLAFLQPLLALLLIAGAGQAEPCLILDERDWSVASSFDTASTWDDPADEVSLALQPSSDRDDDDHGFGALLLSPEAVLVLDQARLIENSQASYPTAPPSHRPCAAPPTGPPLV